LFGVPGFSPSLDVQTDEQKSILLGQLSEKSGLNQQFALQCLEGNGWDLERAWANFMELKVRCLLVPFPFLSPFNSDPLHPV
jgi:nuclear RNA export factor